MLMKTYRKVQSGGPGGYKCRCCDGDGRKHKVARRTARRVERQTWKRELS